MIDLFDRTRCVACGERLHGTGHTMQIGDRTVILCDRCAADPQSASAAAKNRASGLVHAGRMLFDVAGRLAEGDLDIEAQAETGDAAEILAGFAAAYRRWEAASEELIARHKDAQALVGGEMGIDDLYRQTFATEEAPDGKG